MAIGIANKEGNYLIVEFDNYDDIPDEVVMPLPLHNSSKTEPVIYNLTSAIKFYWVKPWFYTDPRYLEISYNGEVIEYIQNAPIERVKEVLDEYSLLTEVEIQKKHILYLKNEQVKQKEEARKLNEDHEKELMKKQVEIDVLRKTYTELLEAIKEKL